MPNLSAVDYWSLFGSGNNKAIFFSCLSFICALNQQHFGYYDFQVAVNRLVSAVLLLSNFKMFFSLVTSAAGSWDPQVAPSSGRL